MCLKACPSPPTTRSKRPVYLSTASDQLRQRSKYRPALRHYIRHRLLRPRNHNPTNSDGILARQQPLVRLFREFIQWHSEISADLKAHIVVKFGYSNQRLESQQRHMRGKLTLHSRSGNLGDFDLRITQLVPQTHRKHIQRRLRGGVTRQLRSGHD